MRSKRVEGRVSGTMMLFNGVQYSWYWQATDKTLLSFRVVAVVAKLLSGMDSGTKMWKGHELGQLCPDDKLVCM